MGLIDVCETEKYDPEVEDTTSNLHESTTAQELKELAIAVSSIILVILVIWCNMKKWVNTC